MSCPVNFFSIFNPSSSAGQWAAAAQIQIFIRAYDDGIDRILTLGYMFFKCWGNQSTWEKLMTHRKELPTQGIEPRIFLL